MKRDNMKMNKSILNYTIEEELYNSGYRYICGVDEAGRGPLCGPVMAAAVILPLGLVIEGLNDSKKLSEAKRERLFDVICENAVAYSIAEATVEEIDQTNILDATMTAMKRAVTSLSVPADFALVDGNVTRGLLIPSKTVIHGDAISPSIAAASILAKVTRDRFCEEMDELYPYYGIAQHKGF